MKKRILSLLLCLAIVFTTSCAASSSAIAKAYYVTYGEEQYTYRDLPILKHKISNLDT